MKRVVAYLFDITVVTLISSLISMTTINPNYEKRLTLNEQYTEKMKEFEDQRKELDESNEEEIRKYLDTVTDYSAVYILESSKAMLFENCVTVGLLVLYFGVFAYFFQGETVGKRILKIKIVKKDGAQVGFGNLLLRLIILHGIPFVIINSIFPFFMNSSSYMILNSITYLLSVGLSLAILITTFVSKNNRGLHDMISSTKVVVR